MNSSAAARRTSLLVVLALLGGLLAALTVAGAPARAARPGVLTPVGCVGDVDGGVPVGHACAAGVEAASGLGYPVVSPDDRFLFASAFKESAVLSFTRSASGALTYRSCVADPPAPAGCTPAEGLGEAWGMAVSPDGRDLYVAAAADHALVRIRVAANGTLSNGGCVSAPTGPCATKVNGLRYAYNVAMAPAGDDFYVAASEDRAVVHFDRSASGSFAARGCWAVDLAGCAAGPGLDSVADVKVSADGRHLVTAGYGGSVTSFTRNRRTGSLSAPRCLTDTLSPAPGCTTTPLPLDGASGLALTRDGRAVYVASSYDDAVTLLRRTSAGTLVGAWCLQDSLATSGCARTTGGLEGVQALALDPDDDQLVTGGSGSAGLVVLDRGADDTLTRRGCVTATVSPLTCPTKSDGLLGIYQMAFSRSGRALHVGGYDSSAIATFRRTVQRAATRFRAARAQKIGKLRVSARCDARCDVAVTGKVRVGRKTFRVKKVDLVLPPGRTTRVRVTFRNAAALKRLLARGARPRAALVVKVGNSAGAKTYRVKVRLRRR
ncbi:hypothetical protein [Nocardioides sp. SYSU D00038]|uniref:lactonase family protein n=1 Tax=Nocardioides sp. SYSU D00038 TaxID=2812554 RepID=UPI0019677B1F|nr:hypothetical protein [Nocardioides sp. SYSU D00038]